MGVNNHLNLLLNSKAELVYSYFEKGCQKKCARDNPER